MKSACFTGHRKIPKDTKYLGERLYRTLEKYINDYGLTDFYAGGAVGWDTFSALTVLELKKVYPDVRLHLVLPCSNEEQTKNWSDEQRKTFYDILSLADSAEYVSHEYCKDCMKLRNIRLVEYADICFCYFNPSDKCSGTSQTVNIANKKQIDVINFFSK